MININQLIADQVKNEQQRNAPQYFTVLTSRDPQIHPDNPSRFLIRGVRSDTGQEVAVVAEKTNENQQLPVAGEAIRFDKAKLSGSKNSVDYFHAEYFHSYGSGFCIQAEARPSPIRNIGPNNYSANVQIVDPAAPAQVLIGTELESDLIRAIVKHLKPWESDEKSTLTHDVTGKGFWSDGPIRGVTPHVVIRYEGGEEAAIFGIGHKKVDSANPDSPIRFPTDAELIHHVSTKPLVLQLLKVVESVKSETSPETLAKFDVSVVPGLTLVVGRARIDAARAAKQEHYRVESAYQATRDGKPVTGYKLSDIHFKASRTGGFTVVETVPVRGAKPAKPFSPLSHVEVERMAFRKAQQEGRIPLHVRPSEYEGDPRQAVAQVQQRSNENIFDGFLSDDEFSSDTRSAPNQRQATQTPQRAKETQVQSHPAHTTRTNASSPSQASHVQHQAAGQQPPIEEFDDSIFDIDPADIEAMETASSGLQMHSNDDLDKMFREAEQISEQRNPPSFGMR